MIPSLYLFKHVQMPRVPIEWFLNQKNGMPDKFFYLSKGSLGSSSFVRLFLEKTLH